VERQEIRIDFKTLDREKVMADMISEKTSIIQQLVGEVQILRQENEKLNTAIEKLKDGR
jgi:hypothetical protein